MSDLQIGVIGTGSIAQPHLASYLANPDADIVAVSDINAERAQSVADRYGLARSYTDPEQLLADETVDAVSICSWNDTHAAMATAAVEAGKHVLVEKPLSRTYDEALELQRIVDQHEQVVMVGFVRRHSPNCQVLRRFIDAGDLGDIYYAKASSIRRNGNPGGWFADKEIAGGGPLLDIGIHAIDLCWYLMGSPRATSVSGNTYTRLGNRAHIASMQRYQVSDYDLAKNSVEDMAAALIRFDNGASLMVDTSYSLHAIQDRLEVSVFGDTGGADLEPALQIATEAHGTAVNLTPQISSPTFEGRVGFQNEIDNFVDSILGRAVCVAPAWHGTENMKIIDGIYASAETGKEITLA